MTSLVIDTDPSNNLLQNGTSDVTKTNGVATPPPSPPETPDWLNDAFLETILRRDTDSPHLTVVSKDVKSAVPRGDNYASVLLRVVVDYLPEPTATETRRRSLIVKSVPPGELMQKWLAETDIFNREARMYGETLPAMYRLMAESTGVEHAPFATRVYSHDRPDTIVLADLAPDGYKMADRRQGLDLAHSVKAIRSLANFHALSMKLHAEDPTCMDHYEERIYSEDMRKMQSDFMVPIFTSLANNTGKWPGFERFEAKIKKVAETAVDRVIQLVKNKPSGVRVMNHGDYWTNNMLFHYDTEGNIDDVKIIDFQMIRFASPALDLIYFLYTSPSQQIMEDHWDEMLEEYHNAVCETMEAIKCDPALMFTMEQLQQEMEDKAFFALVISFMFCIMVAEPEDAPDMSNMTQEEVDSGDFHQMDAALGGKRFTAAFKRRLPKFEAQGLL